LIFAVTSYQPSAISFQLKKLTAGGESAGSLLVGSGGFNHTAAGRID